MRYIFINSINEPKYLHYSGLSFDSIFDLLLWNPVNQITILN